MSMLEVFDRLHYEMTGTRATSLTETSVELESAGTGDLSGLSIVAGFDRQTPHIPDDLYPYLVIEPLSEGNSYAEELLRSYTLQLSLGVNEPGNWGNLVGFDSANGVLDWVETVIGFLVSKQRLAADGASYYTRRIESIDVEHVPGLSENLDAIQKRFANITVTYTKVVSNYV